MSEQGRSAPPRRRSSMAYDPARDTFTEIPDSIPENAVAEPFQGAVDTAVHSSSPRPEQGSVDATKKRRRSESRDRGEKVERLRPGTPDDSSKRQRVSREPTPSDRKMSKSPNPAPRSVSDLPRVPLRAREDGEVKSSRPTPSAYSRRPDTDRPRQNGPRRSRSPPRRDDGYRRRSRSPPRRAQDDAYRRRSPPRHRERPRSPSPIRREPQEPAHRPGGRQGKGRNVLAEQQRFAAEREQREAGNFNRGVQDASNSFYNARPEWVKERGRDWRKNESQIKGLRSYNNWVKSCMIQRFSPMEKEEEEELGWGEEAKPQEEQKPLLVLDIGCGKGGDLGKWQLAPQPIELYVGLDPAATSIQQAEDRYVQMRRGRRPIFDARFVTKDCFGEWIGDVNIVREVGIDPDVGKGIISRFKTGGFDIVTMMFSMHYSFESEDKVKNMLRNVAGSLKKGGRFIGVVPNSDSLAENIKGWYENKKGKDAPHGHGNGDAVAPEKTDDNDDQGPSWGNSIYNVRFPSSAIDSLTPDAAGTVNFRPPTGWKYTYWMAEAVDVPEFVVPWEAFRAICEGYNLEQRYRKPFLEVWEQEKHNREMFELALRMNVIDRGTGQLTMSPEEREAVSFYHSFCFVKV